MQRLEIDLGDMQLGLTTSMGVAERLRGETRETLIRRADETLLGAITLDNIRRGPAQAGTLGYWDSPAALWLILAGFLGAA